MVTLSDNEFRRAAFANKENRECPVPLQFYLSSIQLAQLLLSAHLQLSNTPAPPLPTVAEVTMDELRLGRRNREMFFTEEFQAALRNELHSVMSPITTASDPMDFDLDIHADSPIQWIEKDNGALPHDDPTSTETHSVPTFQKADERFGGLQAASTDPLLFSANVGDPFSLNDPSMQANEHSISPPFQSVIPRVSEVQSSQPPPFGAPQHFDKLPHADPGVLVLPQHSSRATKDASTAYHQSAYGRGRSQSTPQGTGRGITSQRRLEQDYANPFSGLMHGLPDPIVRSTMHSYLGSRSYRREDWGGAAREGQPGLGPRVRKSGHPIEHQNLLHPRSAPVAASGCPPAMHLPPRCYITPTDTIKRHTSNQDESDRLKSKNQKQQGEQAATSERERQRNCLDMTLMHIINVEHLLQKSMDQVKYTRMDDPERYAKPSRSPSNPSSLYLSLSCDTRAKIARSHAESRSQNLQISSLYVPFLLAPATKRSDNAWFDLPQTGIEVKQADGKPPTIIFVHPGAKSCDESSSTDTWLSLEPTIDAALRYYDIPFSPSMFKWEKKRMFLRFIGVGLELMKLILD